MITPLYAALLGLVFIALSVRTLRTRRRLQIGIGDADNPEMQRAMRVHANFAEYVPLALICIAGAELTAAPGWLVHSLGVALLLGRLVHAYGVSRTNEDYRYRVAGMSLTFLALLGACLAVLVLWFGPGRALSVGIGQVLSNTAYAAEANWENPVSIDSSYNFRQNTERVSTSGVVPPAALKNLAADRIEAVINLLPASSEHAVADEPDLVRDAGAEYIYIPIEWMEPTEAHFATFAEAMDRLADKRVHVHCAANWRVSAFYSTWALRRGDMTEAEADALIADLWEPAEHPQWEALIATLRARP